MAKSSRKGVFKRILKQLKPYKFWVATTVFFALVSVAGNLLAPVFVGQIIDLFVGGEVALEKVFEKFIAIGVTVAITCLAQWLMNVINNRITYRVVKDIRESAFKNLQKLPLKFIDAHSYGDIVGRAIADVDAFADGLLMGFTQLFTGVLTIVGVLGVMFAMNWIIALIVFVLTPLSLFVAKFIASRTYSLFKKTSEIRGEQTAFIDEMIGNLKVVKAFNREDENLEKFDEINGRLTKASLKSIFYSSLTNPSTRFVNALVYAAVALAGALMLICAVPLPIVFTVGKLSNLLSYANQYTKPFNEISGVVTELQNAVACAGRIYEIIDETPQTPDAENAAVLENVKGDIEFKDVSFSYVKDKKLIEGLNISAKAGQRIAIVGPTGCGKTTLINLLM
ncbi:MAG: ABC transporter ATP-binding protein, partial [Clostridia bacterium]|nr:ABC transporter ATP-binding protein [Clostridia bacterium]